jgi:16S rRNA (guanine527-N7)-methyltransferase
LAADLGSGGGLPGLVLALAWPASRWVLIDARQRSGSFLRAAAEQLGVTARVEVVVARAEEAGRDERWRARFALAVARGFGPPAVTAECAAPLLVVGGALVVSEPPGSRGDRWSPQGLRVLGMGEPRVVTADDAGYVGIEQVSPCPDRYPRRVGVPAKRPLF